MGELLLKEPLFNGNTEFDQIDNVIYIFNVNSPWVIKY